MTSFNPELTIEEAKELLNFKGTAMWPDTKHNRALIASLIDEMLKKIRAKAGK